MSNKFYQAISFWIFLNLDGIVNLKRESAILPLVRELSVGGGHGSEISCVCKGGVDVGHHPVTYIVSRTLC